MELLDIGEKMGWPKLTFGRPTKVPHDKRILPGQEHWERFCAVAHVKKLMPALRVARVLHINGVEPFHPLSGAGPEVTTQEQGLSGAAAQSDMQNSAPHDENEHRFGLPPQPVTDLLEDIKPLEMPARRPKKGGHKQPPNPRSKRRRL